MCGILGCIHHPNAAAYRPKMLEMTKCIRHRGPDWSGCVFTQEQGAQGSILCHERLAIVGVDTGAQPLVSTDGQLILAVNGEIYNHRILRKNLKNQGVIFKTHSDCEVILHLYREHREDFVRMLDGMFSFILLDTSVHPTRVIAARDPIGITTFYQGWSSRYPGALYFSSELKSIHQECDKLRSFPPGHFYDSSRAAGDETVRYYKPNWLNGDQKGVARPTGTTDLTAVRLALERAVRKRLMSEVPYGVLLSGGLDSSLIAAIAARETSKVAEAQRQRFNRRKASRSKATQADGFDPTSASEDTFPVSLNEDEEKDEFETLAAWPRLHSFSIGLEESPDLIAARGAARYLATVHHEHTFTIQEGLDAISDVIYHLETFDVTTVRASTPMYLLSRKIKAMGVKMVLSGEGSDEIFGGYLYFHAAPNADDFHSETVQRVKNLHMADCLRANKSTMAWGLEARMPFLDKAFLDVSMNIDAEHKMFSKGTMQTKDADGCPYMEKYILRKAFDLVPEGDEKPYLPEAILWRQKEQFSDGVGSSWIDSMKAEAEKIVTDEQMARRAERFPLMTPDTKEAYWLREIFERHFPSEASVMTVQRWIPKAEWGCNADPSGRAQSIHNSYKHGEFATTS